VPLEHRTPGKMILSSRARREDPANLAGYIDTSAMSRNDKISFSLRELATALIRDQGIHEGRWRLRFDFSVSRADVAPSDQGALHGAILVIGGLAIERCDDAPPGTPQVFDAAKENPVRDDAVPRLTAKKAPRSRRH
jgi:hypothetical protein